MNIPRPSWNWSRTLARNAGPTARVVFPATRTDSRVLRRCKTKCPVTLSWQDTEGRTCSIRAHGVDMSGVGARVESRGPMRPGSFVFVQAPELNLMGGAIVRYCTFRGLKYRIGLEFRNPLMKRF